MFAWHIQRMAESSQTDSRALLLPSLAVAGTVLSWAAAFPAIGYALRELEPLPLAAIRFALASVLAFAWLAWKRPKPMSAKDYAIVAVCGVLGIAAYNIFLNSGQTTVSAGAASFIVNTQPLFMAILAVLFLKEAFNRWSWAGTVVGLGGVAVIAAGQPGGMSFGTGSSLIIAAALCTSAYSVLQRQLFARSGPLEVTAYVLITGAVALLPWLAEGVAQLQAASTSTVATVVFLAVAPAAIGQTCWTVAIKSFGAADSAAAGMDRTGRDPRLGHAGRRNARPCRRRCREYVGTAPGARADAGRDARGCAGHGAAAETRLVLTDRVDACSAQQDVIGKPVRWTWPCVSSILRTSNETRKEAFVIVVVSHPAGEAGS
jgi:drug/metabolite transporter (DMT)-like permease